MDEMEWSCCRQCRTRSRHVDFIAGACVRSVCAGPGGLPLGSATHFHNVAIVTHPVHRLQIRPIVHNYGASPTTLPSYILVRVIVWACGRGQTDRHTDVRDHWPQYISRGLRLTRNVTTTNADDALTANTPRHSPTFLVSCPSTGQHSKSLYRTHTLLCFSC